MPEREIKIRWQKGSFNSKPEILLSRVIISSTNINDVVLDPFLGSGTTAVISKKYGRRWIGIEKDKNYIDEALKENKLN